MKLLAAPKPEVLTGEVFCGRHRAVEDDNEWFSYKFGDNVCVLPANHEGECQHENLPGLMRDKKIRVESKEDLYREVYGGSSRRSGKTSAMFDYLNSLGHDAYGREQGVYDWGGMGPYDYIDPFKGKQPRDYNVHIKGSGHLSTYHVEHPDTREMFDISQEDFNTIYKACTVGPTSLDTEKYAKIAREVLKKYV